MHILGISGSCHDAAAAGTMRHATTRRDRAAWLLLALIVIVGGLTRLAGLESQNLVHDPIWSVRVARLDFTAMWREVVADRVHPPLYYVLLWGWFRLVGQSDYAAQLLSLILGVATLPAAFIFLRRISGRAAGLIGAFLLATSPLHWFLSRFPRMYALGLFLATVSFGLFARWLDDPQDRRAWYGWVVASVLLVSSHHFGWFIVIAQDACALFLLRRQLPWGRWIRGHLFLLGTLLVWAAVFYAGASHLEVPTRKVPMSTFSPLEIVPVLAEFNGYLPFAFTGKLGLMLWAIPVAAATAMAWRRDRGGHRAGDGRGALIALFAFAIPLAGIWLALRLSGWDKPHSAYASFMLPGYYALVALGLVALWRSGRAWAPVPVALFLWAALGLASAPQSYAPTPFRGIAAFIRSQGTGAVPVYVALAHGLGASEAFRYYGLAEVSRYEPSGGIEPPAIWLISDEVVEGSPGRGAYPSGYEVTLTRRFERSIPEWVGPWRASPHSIVVARLDRRG